MARRDVLNLPGYDAPIGGYETSPYYAKSQEALSGLGLGLLRGEVPEFYKPLGEIGGTAFETMIGGVRTDIERGVTAQAARLGQRGGAPLEVAGREMARITPALRWQEMLRGVKGRESLLGLGTQIASGVRQTGLTEAAQRQTYQTNLAQIGISQRQFEDKLALNKEQFDATLAEEKRQFEENLKYKVETREISVDQFNQQMDLKNRQLALQAQMWEDQKGIEESKATGQMWSNIIQGVGTAASLIAAIPTGGASLTALPVMARLGSSA